MNRRDQLARAFNRIPLLEGLCLDRFEVSSLPGYTNWSFRVQDAARDWIIRIPRAETGKYIDRASEAHNQQIAGELGIAPRVLWRDDDGLTLTASITPSRVIAAADFEDEAMLRKILHPLQMLHNYDRPFHGQADLGQLLRRYYSMLPPRRQNKFRERMPRARKLLDALASDNRRVPSHNDLVLENLLLAPDGLWLIDWEYSAPASPYWDLATLCNAAMLDQAGAARLLKTYCEAGAAMEESTLARYRELLQLLSDCWMAAFARDSITGQDDSPC